MGGVQVPEIPSERTAVIVWLLANGHKLRTAEIAKLCGISRQGAHAQLSRIARVLPLVLSENEWQLVRVIDDGCQQDVDDAMLT